LPNDVGSGNPLRNKEIANLLKLWGFYNPSSTMSNLKFLQKVLFKSVLNIVV